MPTLRSSVVVRHDGKILELRGNMDSYLTRLPDNDSCNLLGLARDGLGVTLEAALEHCVGTNAVQLEGAVTRRGQPIQHVALTVLPIKCSAMEAPAVCIVFGPSGRVSDAHSLTNDMTEDPVSISRELSRTCAFLEDTLDRLTTSNQNALMANEDRQAFMEELASLNEELEASKEQLVAINRDLVSANEALEQRTIELLEANDDMRNLFGGAAVAALFVTADLRIKLDTPLASNRFKVRPSDIGRAIGDIQATLPIDDLHARIEEAVLLGRIYESKVRGGGSQVYLLRIAPYLTEGKRIVGATVTAVDIAPASRGGARPSDRQVTTEGGTPGLMGNAPAGTLH